MTTEIRWITSTKKMPDGTYSARITTDAAGNQHLAIRDKATGKYIEAHFVVVNPNHPPVAGDISFVGTLNG